MKIPPPYKTREVLLHSIKDVLRTGQNLMIFMWIVGIILIPYLYTTSDSMNPIKINTTILSKHIQYTDDNEQLYMVNIIDDKGIRHTEEVNIIDYELSEKGDVYIKEVYPVIYTYVIGTSIIFFILVVYLELEYTLRGRQGYLIFK